jgi:propanol-preferring alcohol dehydrogenase
VTFAPSGDVVVAALKAVDRGAPVAINAIHLDRIPQLDYDDLWWERSLRSVANVTRADVRDFLAIVARAGIRAQYETLPLAQAPHALERLEAGDIRGAFVLT